MTHAHGPTAAPNHPHGGELVDRLLNGQAARRARERAQTLPGVALSPRAQADLECLATGVYSPLTGFQGAQDYAAVVDDMRLADGTVWPIPVTLPVAEDLAAQVGAGDEVALLVAGEPVGLVKVTDCFRPDLEREARQVFGTEDPEHPGVAALFASVPYRLAGPVWAWGLPLNDRFEAYRHTPAQVRAEIASRRWRSVVAFQTRNPVHRAHEYLQKVALESVDGLLLHPLVGTTKEGDISPDVRLRTYERILEAYYPQDRTLLSVFPAAMRYAGPREAVMHALARKNYGCTHFIVGRDHAGVGDYYGTYAAQEIFDRFTDAELGIRTLRFEHAFFCNSCGQMATTRSCPHDGQAHVHLSGTEVRRLLKAGEMPPPEFTRPEVAEVLVEDFCFRESP